MSEGRVAAVVLAAGESRRFGGRKQLAMFEGRTLLEHVLETAHVAGLRPVVAVVPVWLTRPASASGDLVWVRNRSPELGMSHSLHLGLVAVPGETDAAVILLGDQPGVTEATIGAILAARGRTGLVAAHADGRFAPPVLIERSAFQLAHQVDGDVGLRDIIATSRGDVTAVEIDTHPPDIDTPEDLERISRA